MPRGIYKRKPFTEEHRKNISKKMKGRELSQKHKDRVSKALKGKKYPNKIVTNETRKKMSASHLGRISWNKGKKTPEEVKEKIKKALKGEKGSNWQGGKMEYYPEMVRIRKSPEYKL